MPPALLKRPTLFEDLVPVWNAFQKLSGHRLYSAMGMPGAIPFSEVKVYAELHGISDADHRLEFMHLIEKLDSSFLEYVAKKQKPGKG